MNIAFVVGKFPSLSITFIINQIVGLIERGHKVDIFSTTHEEDEIAFHPEIEKYHILERTTYLPLVSRSPFRQSIKGLCRVGANFLRAPKFYSEIFLSPLKYHSRISSLMQNYSEAFYNTKCHYDIIHCHFLTHGLDSLAIKKLTKNEAKVVVTFHGYDVNVPDNIRCSPLVRDLVFQEVDLYTSNTSYTAMKATKLGCPSDKIQILPVGLDLSKYKFSPPKYQPGEIIRLLSVGRLVEKKGLAFSIQAFAKVALEHPNIEYQIVGDGPLRDRLERLSHDLGIAEKVIFLGGQTQDIVRNIYQQSHIFMLPSVTAPNGDMEGQALVLQEAQAIGLPVISTLHNGIPDGVLDGQSGFLVPERDVDSLAERLLYLIKHPEIWHQMGTVGREFIEKKYDLNMLNDRLVELYRSCL